MNDLKRKKLSKMNTGAIHRILTHLAGPEAQPRSPEYPLGGLVHIDGIGHVSVAALTAELSQRQREAAQDDPRGERDR